MVNTLVPLHVFINDSVTREVVRTLLATIEILRRSMWAILRIEHEQNTNASGFRAALIVPVEIDFQLEVARTSQIGAQVIHAT